MFFLPVLAIVSGAGLLGRHHLKRSFEKRENLPSVEVPETAPNDPWDRKGVPFVLWHVDRWCRLHELHTRTWPPPDDIGWNMRRQQLRQGLAGIDMDRLKGPTHAAVAAALCHVLNTSSEAVAPLVDDALDHVRKQVN